MTLSTDQRDALLIDALYGTLDKERAAQFEAERQRNPAFDREYRRLRDTRRIVRHIGTDVEVSPSAQVLQAVVEGAELETRLRKTPDPAGNSESGNDEGGRVFRLSRVLRIAAIAASVLIVVGLIAIVAGPQATMMMNDARVASEMGLESNDNDDDGYDSASFAVSNNSSGYNGDGDGDGGVTTGNYGNWMNGARGNDNNVGPDHNANTTLPPSVENHGNDLVPLTGDGDGDGDVPDNNSDGWQDPVQQPYQAGGAGLNVMPSNADHTGFESRRLFPNDQEWVAARDRYRVFGDADRRPTYGDLVVSAWQSLDEKRFEDAFEQASLLLFGLDIEKPEDRWFAVDALRILYDALLELEQYDRAMEYDRILEEQFREEYFAYRRVQNRANRRDFGDGDTPPNTTDGNEGGDSDFTDPDDGGEDNTDEGDADSE